ncbi:MAG: putative type VI secretion system effector [Acinetobacter sp.]
MSFKKTDKIIEELEARLFIVEGEVTDLLTRETMQNLNASAQSATSAIAVGSALAGQIGNAALASFAASDEGIEVSDFAVEITDNNSEKHAFRGCFPVVIFKKGDVVKLIVEANPYDRKYDRVAAVIDQKNYYMWTGQEVVKGRIRYRIAAMKFGGFSILFVLFLLFVFDYFISDSIDRMLMMNIDIQITSIVLILISLLIGWNIGSSFDKQSIELEVILKKLGFYKPSRMNLQEYALNDLSWKNKEDNKGYGHERWKDYTYRIDLAQQADKEKYGKSAK